MMLYEASTKRYENACSSGRFRYMETYSSRPRAIRKTGDGESPLIPTGEMIGWTSLVETPWRYDSVIAFNRILLTSVYSQRSTFSHNFPRNLGSLN